MRLYRAAADDYLADTASFAEDLRTARVYLDNPGYGGTRIYSCEVPADARVLDLSDERDAIERICQLTGRSHPGAVSADVWIPMPGGCASDIAALGYQWVRVQETYPEDTVTWIWIGDSIDEPDLEEEP